MSNNTHKTDIIILGILGVATAAVLLALTVMLLARDEREDAWGVRTTHSANVSGMLVYYTLLERLEFSVRRMERPLGDRPPEGQVLYLIDPIVRITPADAQSLLRWVRSGGVLVCTPESQLADSHHIRAAGGHGAHARPTDVPRDTVQTTAARNDHPLGESVESVHLGSRRRLSLGRPEEGNDLGPVKELFADDAGLRVATRKMDRGHVIVLADSSFLANGMIDEADNAPLAVNLAAYALSLAREPLIAFDEYHYGYGQRETGWGILVGLLFTTSPGWAVLCLTAAGVLYLIYRGRKFGSRRGPERTRRRSKMEFVYSVGATYRAAGANRLALRLIYDSFRKKAAEAVGLPPSCADTAQIARRLARHSHRSAQAYGKVFRTCESALKDSSLSRRSFTELLQQMSEVEAEVLNGR